MKKGVNPQARGQPTVSTAAHPPPAGRHLWSTFYSPLFDFRYTGSFRKSGTLTVGFSNACIRSILGKGVFSDHFFPCGWSDRKPPPRPPVTPNLPSPCVVCTAGVWSGGVVEGHFARGKNERFFKAAGIILGGTRE